MKQKKRPAVYIDFDDVLCDTAGGYLEIVRKEFGIHCAFSDIHSFNLQHSFNLNDEQNSRMFQLGHSPDFILSLKPLPGIAEAFDYLQSQFSLAIVTGRHTIAYEESVEWLIRHKIRFDSFTMVDKYGWKDTDHSLAISLEELSVMSFVFAIEDNINMTAHLADTMSTPVLLFDRPWNRSLATNSTIKRCCGWTEILQTSSKYSVANCS